MALQVRGFFEVQPRDGPCGPYPWRVLEDPPRRGVPLVYVVAATALPPIVVIEELRAWDHLHLTLGKLDRCKAMLASPWASLPSMRHPQRNTPYASSHVSKSGGP